MTFAAGQLLCVSQSGDPVRLGLAPDPGWHCWGLSEEVLVILVSESKATDHPGGTAAGLPPRSGSEEKTQEDITT